MGCSESKYAEEMAEYMHLCKLLDDKVSQSKNSNILDYDHYEALKRNPKVEFKNYKYQLKGVKK